MSRSTPNERSQGEQPRAIERPATKPDNAAAEQSVTRPNNRAVQRGQVTTRSMGGGK